MEKSPKSSIPKNVNAYAHLLQNALTSPDILEWYLCLRHYTPHARKARTKAFPPSFLARETSRPKDCMGTTGVQRQVVEIESVRTRAGGLSHLCNHRLGEAANPSQLTFETTLRDFRGVSLPPIRHPESPVRKRKTVETEQSGPFDDSMVSSHSHEMTHLFTSEATIGTLKWSMSLRGREDVKAKRPTLRSIIRQKEL